MKKHLSIIATGLMCCVTACTTLTPSQQTKLKQDATNAVNILAAANHLYEALGKPGLPASAYDTYARVSAGLNSAAIQLQGQVGTPANVAVINTGVPAVNSAIAASVTQGAVVSQGDVNAVYAQAQAMGR